MVKKCIIICFCVLCLLYSSPSFARTNYKNLRQLAELSPESLLNEGARLMKQGDSRGALLCFNLINSSMQRNRKVYAQSLHNAGLVYYADGAYPKAMESYITCLDVCEKMHNDSLTALTYKDIANVYSMYGDYHTSSSLYRRSLKLARKHGDRKLTNMLLNNLIFAYTPKTPLKQYQAWYQEMCRNRESRPRYEYDLLMVAGTLDCYAHHYRASLPKFYKARTYARQHHLMPLCEAEANQSIASAFSSLGRRDSAIHYQLINLAMAEKLNIDALRANTFNALSDLYARTNRQLSLQYKSRYLLLNDSLLNENGLNDIRNTFYYHEMDKQLATISSQQRWIVALIVFSTVLLVLLAVIFMLNRKLNVAYKHLFDRIQQGMAHDVILTRQLSTISNAMSTADSEPDKGECVAAMPSSLPLPSHKDENVEVAAQPSERKNQKEAVQQSKLLTAILNVMENTETFCNFDFSIDTLASMVKSNTHYVSQTINDVYGQNFRTFLNEFRIKKAITRMNDTSHYGNYTIKAIAESVGYKSQSNFINVFTRVTGMKPSTYIKQLRDNQ